MTENTIIEVTCPVCKAVKVQSFEPEYLEDPAFAECAKNPNWDVVCGTCYGLAKEFCKWSDMDEVETSDFLDDIMMKDSVCVEILQENIQLVTA